MTTMTTSYAMTGSYECPYPYCTPGQRDPYCTPNLVARIRDKQPNKEKQYGVNGPKWDG